MRSSQIRAACYVAAAMASVLSGVAVAQTQSAPQSVWRETAPPAVKLRDARSLPLLVDISALAGLRVGDRIELLVAPQQKAIGAVERIEERSSASRSIFGRIEGDPDSMVILVLEQDAAVGLIDSPANLWRFSLGYAADGVHQITPIDGHERPCKNPRGPAPRPAGIAGQTAAPRDVADDGGIAGTCSAPRRRFDMMIFYTPSARAEAGGTSAMQAQCQLAVDTANQTYADSQISPRMFLVYRAEISYSENSDVEVDRDRLADTSDGIMDSVHGTRNTYGADFVTLFVKHNDDACGIAFCTPSDSTEGFCIVDWSCASDNFSYAHEVGHLQGCAHNPEDAGSGCNEYCDSYGYRFLGNTGYWRTVMAYDTDPARYTRVGRWSNPNISYDGHTCGRSNDCDDDRYNAATVNATSANRESWRASKFDVWVESNVGTPWAGTYWDPWPNVVLGVNAIYGGASTPLITPRLRVKAGTYPGAVTFSKAMTVESCGGTARIGG